MFVESFGLAGYELVPDISFFHVVLLVRVGGRESVEVNRGSFTTGPHWPKCPSAFLSNARIPLLASNAH